MRGQIFIHASAKVDKEGYEIAKSICDKLKVDLPLPEDLQTGGIVGVMTIVDTVKSRPRDPFFFGPVGFIVAEAKPIKFIPYKGRLSFFETHLRITPKGRVRPTE